MFVCTASLVNLPKIICSDVRRLIEELMEISQTAPNWTRDIAFFENLIHDYKGEWLLAS